MAEPPQDLDALLALWLNTQLLVRSCGRSLDLDKVPRRAWQRAIAPLVPPITLVTGWNPGGRETGAPANRAANRRLRADLEARGWAWRPALGRARDGSWAEPGFAVGGLAETAAADLGRALDQLALYLVDADEVAVLASDGSFRVARRRG